MIRDRRALWQAYAVNEAGRGLRLAAAGLRRHGEHGELLFAQACCLERLGRLREADGAFCRASRAPRFPQPLPYRCGWARFRRVVDASAAALPEALRSALSEVSLVLADYADPDLLAEFDEPEILGLFSGTPKNEIEPGGTLSPTIHLWRRAHEHAATHARDFDAEVRQTLWHELGHYLGYDEDELDALGRG